MNRLRGDGFYILDEPEAALSPSRQLSFLSRLHELVGEGCQFLIATHSPILMAYPQAAIYLLADGAAAPRRLSRHRALHGDAQFPHPHRADAATSCSNERTRLLNPAKLNRHRPLLIGAADAGGFLAVAGEDAHALVDLRS